MEKVGNVININGTDYNENDLSDTQKYLIAQIKDLQDKAGNFKFQLDQVQVSLNSFTNALIQELEKNTEETEEQKVS
tara:strand:- start:158 stop:388 length:231 start_codon:yes stop_codon:yes gene_type:complete